jgi:glycosyltransferase involved in cell wall biosynthesis
LRADENSTARISSEDLDPATSAFHVPLVSVLIPTYNRPTLLVGAVASARAQTVADIEILVRDDAGGGNVQGLLAEIRDDRIVYRRNSQNLGPAATNILLYKEARGKYVAHLDDDDEWESQFLARLVEPLEQYPDLNLTFCNDVVIDAVGRPQLARTAIVEKRKHSVIP